MLLWFATAVVLLIVPAHLVWFLDRRRGDIVGNDPKYLPGIFRPAWSAEALLEGKVDAVVLAAPALQYYETHRGAGKVKVVGPGFSKRDLGFVVPLHSPWHRRIDSALVSLHDDGTYERLREKWFGKE